MRCPPLNELPPPPPGKTGWPWTEESAPLPDHMPDGNAWPRITVVTPSFNQGQFVEETIRSILLQGYPNLEYLILDGASTDNSVEVIKKYAPWLSYWVSEPDRGQSHAINKGMNQASGEIVAWLNSDDLYLSGALERVARIWHKQQTHWVVGKIRVGEFLESAETKTLRLSSSRKFLEIAAFWLVRERNLRTFTQPEVFMSLRAWKAVGGLSENLNIAMDYHLWAKLAAIGYVPTYLPEEIAFFRIQRNQKTQPYTANYLVNLSFDRAWALYDALRLGRGLKCPPPDLTEVENLLESKVGAFCQVLDTWHNDGGWPKMGAATASAIIHRPNATLRYLSSIVRTYTRGKLTEFIGNGNR